jgi:hypothetical protein
VDFVTLLPTRTRLQRHWLFRAAILLAVASIGCLVYFLFDVLRYSDYSLSENFQCDRVYVYGDRVLYVVETKCYVNTLPDSPTKEANLRDYVYTVRLADDGTRDSR